MHLQVASGRSPRAVSQRVNWQAGPQKLEAVVLLFPQAEESARMGS